jgi:ribose-phosphate pyrophosphokinase
MVLLPMPGNEGLSADLAERLGAEVGTLAIRRFPDGESYVRLVSDVRGRNVVLVCTLADPDPKALPLLFAARTARLGGAASVTLVAPYLAYMRQDMAFNEGEAATSAQFAALLSSEVDRLITVDPHLHRYRSLAEIYAVPAAALAAAPLLAAWIKANVAAPLVVGPDAESEQWARAVADGAPCVVLEKRRFGDREVEIRFPDLAPFSGRQAVVVDDVASSGRTLIETCQGLQARGFGPPICAVVHALFAPGAYEAVCDVASTVVSTDSVLHPSNHIGIAPLIAAALD